MEHKGNIKVASQFKTVSVGSTLSKEQADALAYRITPEIKKFFADEQVQKEFAEWKKKRGSA